MLSTNITINPQETEIILLQVDPSSNPEYHISTYAFELRSQSATEIEYTVDFCKGTPGVIPLLTVASEIFKEKKEKGTHL